MYSSCRPVVPVLSFIRLTVECPWPPPPRLCCTPGYVVLLVLNQPPVGGRGFFLLPSRRTGLCRCTYGRRRWNPRDGGGGPRSDADGRVPSCSVWVLPGRVPAGNVIAAATKGERRGHRSTGIEPCPPVSVWQSRPSGRLHRSGRLWDNDQLWHEQWRLVRRNFAALHSGKAYLGAQRKGK
jgi:hypothetical protein